MTQRTDEFFLRCDGAECTETSAPESYGHGRIEPRDWLKLTIDMPNGLARHYCPACAMPLVDLLKEHGYVRTQDFGTFQLEPD